MRSPAATLGIAFSSSRRAPANPASGRPDIRAISAIEVATRSSDPNARR